MKTKDKKKQAGSQGLVPKLRFPEFRGTGEWKKESLGLYLEQYSEKVPSSTDLDVYSSTRDGLKPQNEYYNGRQIINDGEYGIVPNGYFVYRHMSDDDVFKFNINTLGEKIAVSKEYPVFKTVNLSSEFLVKKLNEGIEFKKFAVSQKKGGTRTRLYFKTLCSFECSLPSFEEQQRIADCLSSLDELIAAQAHKLDTLKAHKKGLMQQLFPAPGRTTPTLRFPEFRDAGEWEKKIFGKLLKINSGKGFKAAEYSNNGIRLIQIENVGYGKIKWRENTIYLPQNYIKDYQELILRKGDIVLALNRPITNGELKIAILTTKDDPSLLYQRVGKLEKISDLIVGSFVFYIGQKFIKEFVIKQSIGSDQPFISLRELYKLRIFIPSPSEQQKIADCLSSLDELIAAQAHKLDTLKAHKKGLMQQLFPNLDEVNG